jgi:hypothetical protein
MHVTITAGILVRLTAFLVAGLLPSLPQPRLRLRPAFAVQPLDVG